MEGEKWSTASFAEGARENTAFCYRAVSIYLEGNVQTLLSTAEAALVFLDEPQLN